MWRLILKYALILFISLSFFKFLEFQFFSRKLTLELYLVFVATAFLLIGFFVSRRFAKKSVTYIEKQTELDQQQLAKLSGREQEMIVFLSQGYTNKEIAKSLEISPNTVKTHLSRLFEKLGVSNRTQAVAEAKLLNIIN